MIERKTWIGKFLVMYHIKREYYRMSVLKSIRWAAREAGWWTESDKRAKDKR